MSHCPLEPLASKQPPAISEGLVPVLSWIGGISSRVWVWTQTPPLGADTARGWQNPMWHNCAGFSAHRMCAQYRNLCSRNCTAQSMGSSFVQMNSKEHQPLGQGNILKYMSDSAAKGNCSLVHSKRNLLILWKKSRFYQTFHLSDIYFIFWAILRLSALQESETFFLVQDY